jgi:hypothetical protein
MPACGIGGCTIVGGAGGGFGPPIAKNISAAEAGVIATGAAMNSAVATPKANVVKRVIVVSHFSGLLRFCYQSAAFTASGLITRGKKVCCTPSIPLP